MPHDGHTYERHNQSVQWSGPCRTRPIATRWSGPREARPDGQAHERPDHAYANDIDDGMNHGNEEG